MPSEQLRQSRAHRDCVWREPRTLGEDRDVDVADLPAVLRGTSHHLGEQHGAVDAAKACVGVRKVLAEVSGRGRAEQRVSHGVQHHVAIGVTEQTALEGDVDAGEAQWPARHEPVDVPALPDPHHPPTPGVA
jgi:hypothetical protein